MTPKITAFITQLQDFTDDQKVSLADKLDTFAKSLAWLDARRNLFGRFDTGDERVDQVAELAANCADWFLSGPQFIMAGEAAMLAALELLDGEIEPFFLNMFGLDRDALQTVQTNSATKKRKR
jgi:hypothetical protein